MRHRFKKRGCAASTAHPLRPYSASAGLSGRSIFINSYNRLYAISRNLGDRLLYNTLRWESASDLYIMAIRTVPHLPHRGSPQTELGAAGY